MVRVVIEDKKGLVQKAGGGVAIEPKLELKNHTALKVPPGSSGALGYKVDRGVLVGASITTGIARASAVATGAHTLTAVNVSKGHVTVTASGTEDAVTTLTKAHHIALFGGANNITVGDEMTFYLHNAGTNVAHTLKLTANTGSSIQSGQAILVAANAADNSASVVGGSSTAAFSIRVTNVDGSAEYTRLS
jgi:hypothetical protein